MHITLDLPLDHGAWGETTFNDEKATWVITGDVLHLRTPRDWEHFAIRSVKEIDGGRRIVAKHYDMPCGGDAAICSYAEVCWAMSDRSEAVLALLGVEPSRRATLEQELPELGFLSRRYREVAKDWLRDGSDGERSLDWLLSAIIEACGRNRQERETMIAHGCRPEHVAETSDIIQSLEAFAADVKDAIELRNRVLQGNVKPEVMGCFASSDGLVQLLEREMQQHWLQAGQTASK